MSKKPARTIMIQGTASNAGKSIIVTALCRIFRQDGYSVAPFKSQNMSLNSFVTREGGEIGRAQVVQAEAAGIEPTVDMNPVLLKPEAEARSQVIVLGKLDTTLSARSYYQRTPDLLKVVKRSLENLRSIYDIVVIEGAGSPAEVNLKEREIVNMRVAKMAGAPVLLVGDIDRGGVLAAIVGTLEILDEDERDYIKGFIINKFRGDQSLFQTAVHFLEDRTGRPVIGIVPYFRDITIAQEDSVYLDDRRNSSAAADLDIAVIRLPHISNYDDFDPLETEGCRLRYISRPDEMGTPDLVILPGTKSTMADLGFLRQSGLADEILRLAESGRPVIGICGGYQILGKSLNDPDKVESSEETAPGLGLLEAVTTFIPRKSTSQVRARVEGNRGLLEGATGQEVVGYEIHMGQTTADDYSRVFHVFETPDGRADYFDGTINDRGMVMGTYLHGLFHNADFTNNLLNFLRRRRGLPEKQSTAAEKDRQYDRLADLVRSSLNMESIYKIMNSGVSK